MDQKKREMKEEFLRLTPYQRIKLMSQVFNDFITLKAKAKGVPEREIYREYFRTH